MGDKIQFKCPQCQADFGVEAKFAGRPCRCKHCGKQFKIPGSIVSSTGAGRQASLVGQRSDPRPPVPQRATTPPQKASPQAVGAGYRGGFDVEQRGTVRDPMDPKVPRPTSWIDAVSSQIALKPVTMDQMQRIGGRAQKYLAQDEDVQSGPYVMASFPSLPLNQKPRTGVIKGTKKAYSNQLRKTQKWLRWINETALELSIPFFVLMPLGFILQKHWLSMFGLTMMILLNAGRLIVGLANLLVIPFRESPMTGLMFLVPPFGYSYLKQNWHICRKPFQRIISPVCFMLGMFLIYAFVPWFNDPEGKHAVKMVKDKNGLMVPAPPEDQPRVLTIREQLEQSAKKLRKEIKGQIEEAKEDLPSARTKLEKFAGEAIDQAQKAAGNVQEAAQKLQEGTTPESAIPAQP